MLHLLLNLNLPPRSPWPSIVKIIIFLYLGLIILILSLFSIVFSNFFIYTIKHYIHDGLYVLVRPQGTNTQIFTKRSKKITKWVVNERYKRSNELKKKNAQIYISTKKNMFVKTHILLHNSITIEDLYKVTKSYQ